MATLTSLKTPIRSHCPAVCPLFNVPSVHQSTTTDLKMLFLRYGDFPAFLLPGSSRRRLFRVMAVGNQLSGVLPPLHGVCSSSSSFSWRLKWRKSFLFRRNSTLRNVTFVSRRHGRLRGTNRPAKRGKREKNVCFLPPCPETRCDWLLPLSIILVA